MSLEMKKRQSLEKFAGGNFADEDLKKNVSGGMMANKRSFATGVGDNALYLANPSDPQSSNSR